MRLPSGRCGNSMALGQPMASRQNASLRADNSWSTPDTRANGSTSMSAAFAGRSNGASPANWLVRPPGVHWGP